MPSRTAFFTICSNNYIAYAKVLLQSAKAHHPDVDFFVCIVDEKLDQEGLYDGDWQCLWAHELDIPNFRSVAFQYTIMELNTAVKPSVFLSLFDRGFDNVVYFDPDIEIFRPLDQVIRPLDEGASFLLTPHLRAPAENGSDPDDMVIMRAGIYNLGFLGCSRQRESERIIRWWARRLRYECISRQEIGIFVDQKFMDLVPGFADNCRILRDPTVNLAYWNLAQHTFERTGDTWLVDGEPLSFFHYSGIEPGNTKLLSKYSKSFRGSDIYPALRDLILHYFERLRECGHDSVPNGLYAYSRFASGTPIHDHVRDMYREHYSPWIEDPFESFEELLHLPSVFAKRSSPFVMTNFLKYLWDRYYWIRATFNPNSDQDIERFVKWYVDNGVKGLGLDPRLVEPVAMTAGYHRFVPGAGKLHAANNAGKDITVTGYLKMVGGVGEAGRQTLKALARTQYRVVGHDIAAGVVANREEASCDHLLSDEISGRVQIYHVNADQMSIVLEAKRDVTRVDGYRIGVAFWELAEFPSDWVPALEAMDEIWAPTRFIQMALFRKIARPITYMPLNLTFDPPEPKSRAQLKLPDKKFLFFFAFDFLSFQDRKNPRGAYRAFRQAFPRSANGSSPVGLVIKTLNGEHAAGQLADLRDELEQDPDVTLIDGTLPRDHVLGLIGACDCVLSLHRSEGLGLLVAEAMLLGKPVIATDYSATTELLNPSTGYPVGYRLIDVQPEQYPFAAGQWADPDLNHAAWLMRRVAAQPEAATAKGKYASHHLRDTYGADRVAERQRKRLIEIGLECRQ